MDDDRFEQWWAQVALPQIDAHLVTRMNADQIKIGAKQCWDAALSWHPPQRMESES